MTDPEDRPRSDDGYRDDASPTMRGRRGRRLILGIALAVVVVIALVWIILFNTAY